MAKTELIASEIDQKKRKELLEAMTPDCRKAALDIEKLDHQVRRGTVLVAWDIGDHVLQLQDDAKFGVMAVAQIAAYLSYPGGADALNRLKDFRVTFPSRAWVIDQLKLPRKNGRPLDLSVFLSLVKLDDKKAHAPLLKKVREENLSSNDLETYIKAHYERKNERKSGRHPQIPGTPLGCLQKGFEDAQKLANFLRKMKDMAFPGLEHLESKEVDQRTVQRVEQFESKLVEAQAEIEDVLTRTASSKSYLLKCLDSNEEPEIEEEIEAEIEDVEDDLEGDDAVEETVPVHKSQPAKKKAKPAKVQAPPPVVKTKAKKKVERKRPAPV